MAAIDGVISERTISVSSNKPMPMVMPPWPTLSRSPEIIEPMVKANTRPAAVTTAHWLPGQVQVFIHGEAQAVMHNLRPYIRKEREVDAKWASISGYWRRGRTEETFRQWKKELAAAEAGDS